MKETRLPLGHSDPISYTCTCTCSIPSTTGLVLLFYRYFSAPPILPSFQSLSSLSTFHSSLTTSLHIGGKIRVSPEGFNVTVGGPRASIEEYMNSCLAHWSFANLNLDTQEEREAFFKPTPGCACVFGGTPASVRIAGEITPMGVTDYVPGDWDGVRRVGPEAFHELCERDATGKRVLMDVRNHYESRIGYFVDGSGREAVRPGIRRFAQWPGFVRRWAEGGGRDNDDEDGEGRKILAYCTGGIRCEKATRWMLENASMRSRDEVYTLEGGIQAYLMWMDEEIRAGRKTARDSLFKGRNYVFDARGSLGLGGADEAGSEPVAECHACGRPEDRLGKCRSRRCHLVLVVCESCEVGDVRCCGNCLELDMDDAREGPRPICLCEMEREAKLWGEDYVKRKTKGKKKGVREGIDIQIKTFD